MKTIFHTPFVLPAALLLALACAAQESEYVVPIRFVHNGHPVPGPSTITISVGKASAVLPVRQGAISVAKKYITEPTFGIRAELGKDTITISGIRAEKLESAWTVLLADKSFGQSYKNALPRGANVRSACILLFEPHDAEPTGMGVTGCRAPTARQGPKP
jgi:hypothetical protein